MMKKYSLGMLLGSALLCVASEPGAVEYGKGLVEEVARCGDCHTPRTQTGEPDRSKWLKGVPLHSRPSGKTDHSPKAAPDLTASGRLVRLWGEQGMAKFLETGAGPDGRPANPHMPAYRLRPNDAEAIAAYLNSLK